jgi:hypothetical protein
VACCHLGQSTDAIGGGLAGVLHKTPRPFASQPETIRESDVEKLAFAVDLAGGFYSRVEARQRKYHNLIPGSCNGLLLSYSQGHAHPVCICHSQ